MAKLNLINSERFLDEKGRAKYRDVIERDAQELINVWNPNETEKRTKHFKSRNSIEAKKRILALSIMERAFLFTVEPYMDWESNILIGDGVTAGRKKQPLLWKEIDKITGMDIRARRKAVQGLIEKNVIGFILTEEKKKGIIINPDYALHGRKPTEALINAFHSEVVLEDEEPD